MPPIYAFNLEGPTRVSSLVTRHEKGKLPGIILGIVCQGETYGSRTVPKPPPPCSIGPNPQASGSCSSSRSRRQGTGVLCPHFGQGRMPSYAGEAPQARRLERTPSRSVARAGDGVGVTNLLRSTVSPHGAKADRYPSWACWVSNIRTLSF